MHSKYSGGSEHVFIFPPENAGSACTDVAVCIYICACVCVYKTFFCSQKNSLTVHFHPFSIQPFSSHLSCLGMGGGNTFSLWSSNVMEYPVHQIIILLITRCKYMIVNSAFTILIKCKMEVFKNAIG